jgi:hypothetical protein
MKKLILSAVLTAFAVAVYAGESCDGSSCCSSKTKTSLETKAGSCPASNKTVTKATKEKSGASKQVLKSPKAMSLASR